MKTPAAYHPLDLSYQEFTNMDCNISYVSIGNYNIFEKIGKGGFGQVYKGMNDHTKLPVAAKVIDLHLIKEEKNIGLREIKLRLSKNQDKIMQMCDSPNLVKCLDVYANQDLKIIVMQYCNGGTLQDQIYNRKKIPEKEAILILKQILNGIAELHSHNIIHRDLKAENILMHNNFFKIADFGFSKKLMLTNEAQINKHTCLGTYTTMAPQVMARQPYGLKADIWSVGVIFFQMLFGEYPFKKTNKFELIQEIKSSNLMKAETLVYKGITISKEAYDFLKLILVVDQKQRIGWRQLIRHPILKEKQSESKISRFLYDDMSLVIPLNADDQQNPEELQFPSLVRKESQIVKVIKIFNRQQKNKKDQMIQSDEDKAFKWMKVQIYQCLKSELIFQEIVQKIQKYQLLDLEKREVIQLMYLLSTRCFLDLSPIHHQMCNLKKKFATYNKIYEAVEKLYIRLKNRWQHYQNVLTDTQNQILNKIGDFFSFSENIQRKNKFMNGIQNKDYEKKQQLKFIQNEYINPLLKKMPENAESTKVRDYLNWYKQINQIAPQVFKKQGFDNYIQKLIQKR